MTQPVQPRVNVRIDSAWFDTPMRLTGRSEVLHVRIFHDAQRPVDDLPLSLDINGRRAAVGSFGLGRASRRTPCSSSGTRNPARSMP